MLNHVLLKARNIFLFFFASPQGFAQSFLRRMSHRSSIPGCGITFEIVSNIPEVNKKSEYLNWLRASNFLIFPLF